MRSAQASAIVAVEVLVEQQIVAKMRVILQERLVAVNRALAVFFDLDSELTSSVFMVSTVSFLLFVLPVYLFWAQPSF